ncbi:DUF883 family protein [Candidatus Pacearchaeota archaeon]|nr:DUF883 family protein [Candidatus Pacearchaeota archaeon]
MPVRKTISNARERLREGYEDAREKLGEIEDSSVRYIKKNPVKSVLIAAGIGAVIGAGIAVAISAMKPRKTFWEKHNPLGWW